MRAISLELAVQCRRSHVSLPQRNNSSLATIRVKRALFAAAAHHQTIVSAPKKILPTLRVLSV